MSRRKRQDRRHVHSATEDVSNHERYCNGSATIRTTARTDNRSAGGCQCALKRTLSGRERGRVELDGYGYESVGEHDPVHVVDGHAGGVGRRVLGVGCWW